MDKKEIESMRRMVGGLYSAYVRARAALDKKDWDMLVTAARDGRFHADNLKERALLARERDE